MSKLLEVKNLKTSFKTHIGDVQSVRGVSFHLEKGEALGVVGESGCGKSVTMMTIMRLLGANAKIDAERIFFDDKDITKPTEKLMQTIRGNDMSMIFQDPMTSLNPTMTIGNQIMEPMIHHYNTPKEEAYKKAVELLQLVGITNAEKRMKNYPHQLSGGMRQRIVIAIALSCDPYVLICDEPTTALDVTIQAQIMELLKSMQMQEGKSIVLITHNMGLVAEMADEVCVMYMGRIVEFGTLEDIFDRTSHPYTKALLRSVPVLGLADGQKLETIPGSTPNPADLKGGCEFADRCDQCCDECREKDIPLFEVSSGHHVRCLKYKDYPEVN